MVIKRFVVGLLATNCYIISDKNNAFIIDPGGDAEVIKAYVKKNRLNVQFVVNTHNHIDHILADSELGYPIYIHQFDAPGLEDINNNHSRLLLGSFQSCTPARRLRDNEKIQFADVDITILHTPGHTPGGICLLMDNVVFTGDTLFREGIGRTDLPDASYSDIIASITNKLLCLDDSVTIYPGHGEASTIGRERGNF